MRYGFRLDGQTAVAGARVRAARLGPTFDGYPGIIFKFYLIDTAAPSLDAFIVWSTPGYAMLYLGSPEFDRQVKAFGRPRVEHALPTKINQPSPDLRTVTLVPGEPDVPGVSWLSASDGENSTLAYGDRPGQQFEVAYVVRGGGA